MRTEVPIVAPSDDLGAVGERVERAGAAFVVERDLLAGLLTTDQVAAYAAFHARRAPAVANRPRAVRARTARGAKLWHADVLAERERRHARTERVHRADDLVTRHER